MRKFHLPLNSFLGAAFLVLAGLLLFPAAGRDDAYITYWASYSLVKYGQVLNYNLAHVEQSSSLAQVLLIGGFARLFNLDVELFGRISGILCGALTFFALEGLLPRVGQKYRGLAILVLAASPTFIYWSFGGLETSLAALSWLVFVVFETLYLEGNNPIWLVTAGLLVIYIRPENAVVIGLLSVVVLLMALYRHFFQAARSPETRTWLMRAVRLVLANLVLILAGLVLRYLWFGDIFPQPVRAKTGGLSGVVLRQGLQYLVDTFFNFSTGPLALAALVGMGLVLYGFIAKKNWQPFLLNTTAFAGIYLAFMVLTGGDWMEGGRFAVHILPLLAVLAAFAFSQVDRHAWRVGLISVLVILQLVGMVQFAVTDSTAVPAWKNISLPGVNLEGFGWFERHNVLALRDMPTITALEEILPKALAVKSPLVVMSGQMGMVPYYTAQKFAGQVIWLDRSGLADRVFTTCPETAGWERETRGHLHFTYNTFMRYLPQLQTQCNIPTPDIIFDLGLNIGQVADHGFAIVYSQSGKLNGGIGSGQENLLEISQFIAVNQKYPAIIQAVGSQTRDFGSP